MTYLLSHEAEELKRLDSQQHIIQSTFGYVLHPSLQYRLPANFKLLDSGAGTLAFLKSVHALYPQAQLSGYDLKDTAFTEQARKTFNLFVRNVLDPVPEDFRNAYDVVHQRLLVFGLEDSQWSTAIDNLVSMAKTGGWIQLVEFNTTLVPTERGLGPASLTGNGTMADLAKFRVQYVADRLEGIMAAAGLDNIEVQKTKLPIGAAAAGIFTEEGMSELDIDNFGAVLKMIMANHPMEKWRNFDSETWIAEWKKEAAERGAYVVAGLGIGQKRR